MATSQFFPKYLLHFGENNKKFIPFNEAFRSFDQTFVRVSFGQYVLNEDMTVRDMTDGDKKKILEAVERYNASK